MEETHNILEIKKLWNEQVSKKFPSSSRGFEVEGADLVLVDSIAAGCIDTFVKNKGRLDANRKNYLIGCNEVLEKAVAVLSGDTKEYFSKLLTISIMIVNSFEQDIN